MKRVGCFVLCMGAFGIFSDKAAAKVDPSYLGSLFSEVWETTPAGTKVITPKWMAIKGQPGPRDETHPDFCDELRLSMSTISQGCDERLHFNHPIGRNDFIHSPQQAG